MIRLEAVVLVGPVCGVLAYLVVDSREHGAILPHLWLLGCQPFVLRRKSHSIRYVQYRLDLRLRQLYSFYHRHMSE